MYKAIVIGASYGGVRAIQTVLSSLRPNFSLPIAIVQHLGPDSTGLLSTLLASSTDLTVKEAEDKEPIQPGVIYVAPPNYHFLIEKDATVVLSVDEKECYSRPSIDVLFESAADAYGDEVIAVVLTGASSDGAQGVKAIKMAGGTVIVEKPDTAEANIMPEAARKIIDPNYILPKEEIGPLIARLAKSGEK